MQWAGPRAVSGCARDGLSIHWQSIYSTNRSRPVSFWITSSHDAESDHSWHISHCTAWTFRLRITDIVMLRFEIELATWRAPDRPYGSCPVAIRAADTAREVVSNIKASSPAGAIDDFVPTSRHFALSDTRRLDLPIRGRTLSGSALVCLELERLSWLLDECLPLVDE
jgi:hypothetical protein